MNQDYYIKLIYKQLKGIISDEEAEQLKNWLTASIENQNLAEGIHQAWDVSDNYEIPFELDLDNDYTQLQRKIQKNQSTENIKQLSTRKSRKIWLQIAAALIVVVVAGFLLRNYWSSEEKWISQTAQDDILEVSLSDGSKVFLNTGSTLSYPEIFSSTERKMKLQGEAFFKVSKDVNRPFRVHSADLKIEVLGTAFNVKDQSTNGQATVHVEEGKVKINSSSASKELILTANEAAYLKDQKFDKVQDTNLNALAWKRKSLYFSNTKFELFIEDIAQQYQLEITLDNPFMDDCPVSGRYNINTPIEKIFKALSETYKLEVQKVNEQSYILIGGNCIK